MVNDVDKYVKLLHIPADYNSAAYQEQNEYFEDVGKAPISIENRLKRDFQDSLGDSKYSVLDNKFPIYREIEKLVEQQNMLNRDEGKAEISKPEIFLLHDNKDTFAYQPYKNGVILISDSFVRHNPVDSMEFAGAVLHELGHAGSLKNGERMEVHYDLVAHLKDSTPKLYAILKDSGFHDAAIQSMNNILDTNVLIQQIREEILYAKAGISDDNIFEDRKILLDKIVRENPSFVKELDENLQKFAKEHEQIVVHEKYLSRGITFNEEYQADKNAAKVECAFPSIKSGTGLISHFTKNLDMQQSGEYIPIYTVHPDDHSRITEIQRTLKECGITGGVEAKHNQENQQQCLPNQSANCSKSSSLVK